MNTTPRLIACLLAMIMLVMTMASCNKKGSPVVKETGNDETTQPGTTQPGTTEPVTTQPVTTEPIVYETITDPILNKSLILSSVDSFQSYPLTNIIGHEDPDHPNTDGKHTNAGETMTRGEWFEENIPFIETPE